MITHRDGFDPFAHGVDDARAFVAEDDGHWHREVARHDVIVAVAHTGGFHAHGHFTRAGRQDFDLLDAHRLARFVEDGGEGLLGHAAMEAGSTRFGKESPSLQPVIPGLQKDLRSFTTHCSRTL